MIDTFKTHVNQKKQNIQKIFTETPIGPKFKQNIETLNKILKALESYIEDKRSIY